MSLTRRWPRLVVIGVAVALAIGLVVVVAAILLDKGQGPPTDADRRALAEQACPRVTAPHLYRVTKAGKTSYLLATRHAGVALAQFPPEVDRAFRSSRVAVFESAMDEAPVAAGKGPNQTTIEALLGPALWDKYRGLVGDDAAERINHASPLVATAHLSLLYEDTSRSIDRELYGLAKSAGKQLVVLEDRGESDHLSESYLGVDTLRMFVKAVRDRDDLAAGVRGTLTHYCLGGRDPAGGLGARLEELTLKRTRAWVPKLEALFGDGDVFVAVGSTHVESPLGLATILRADGYDVRP